MNAVLKDETLWLTQLAMTQLFEVDKSSISRHLKNIFAEGELDEGVVVAKFATTTPHGAIARGTQEHAVCQLSVFFDDSELQAHEVPTNPEDKTDNGDRSFFEWR